MKIEAHSSYKGSNSASSFLSIRKVISFHSHSETNWSWVDGGDGAQNLDLMDCDESFSDFICWALNQRWSKSKKSSKSNRSLTEGVTPWFLLRVNNYRYEFCIKVNQIWPNEKNWLKLRIFRLRIPLVKKSFEFQDFFVIK